MIVSVDVEKSILTKYIFLDKNSQQIGYRRNISQHNKGHV